jgi:hypothetical protein
VDKRIGCVWVSEWVVSTTDDVDKRIGCECVWLSEWVVLRMTWINGLLVSESLKSEYIEYNG